MSQHPDTPPSLTGLNLSSTVNKYIAQVEQYRQIIRLLKQALVGWMALIALPAEIYLHLDLGERYLSFFNLFLAILTHILIAVLFIGSEGMGGWIFGVGLLGMVVLHTWRTDMRNKQGKRWHSRSPGIPWAMVFWNRFRLDEFRAQLVGEPLLLTAISVVLLVYDQPIGYHTLTIAIALFGKNVVSYHLVREQFLNQMDSAIEAENMPAALGERPSMHEAEGFAVPGASLMTQEQRGSLQTAFERLQPQMEAEEAFRQQVNSTARREV